MTTVYTPLSSAQQQQLGNSTTNNTKEVAMTKPKRPLSSYNLFYRFKRQHIIELGKGSKKDDIIALVAIQPGLENTYPNIPTDATNIMSVDEINELRKTNIRNDMINNLCPRETSTRRHRKSNAMNGEMSFLELGKLMNSSWQSCDEFAKTVFNDLANEGRELYRQRMAKYNLLTNEIAEDHHRNMLMSSTQQQQQPQGVPQVYTSAPHGMMGGVSPLPSMKRKVSPTSLLQQQMGGGVVSMGEGLSAKEWVQSMSNMLSNNSNNMMGHSQQQQSSPVPYMGPPQGMQGQFSGNSSPFQGGLSRTHSPQDQGQGPGYRRLVTQDIKLLETNRNKLCANMKALEEVLNAAKLRVRVYELEAQQKHQEELFREQMMRMQQASVASSASRGGTLAPTLPPLPEVSPQDVVNTGGQQMGMMMSQEEMKEQMMRHFGNHHHDGDSPSASSNIMSGQTTLREVASHLTPSVAQHSRRVTQSSLSTSSPSSQQDQQSQDGLSWLASAASSIGRGGGGGSGMSMSSMNQMPPLPLNSDNDQQGDNSNKKQRLS